MKQLNHVRIVRVRRAIRAVMLKTGEGGAMKHLLIALMLVIMGQRWEFTDHASFKTVPCTNASQWTACIQTETYYRLVYVIGEQHVPIECMTVSECYPKARERFTIPVPNTPSKAMSAIEADLRNKDLADPRLRGLMK